VIPAKDPQNGVPQPRQGAAVVAVSSAIVGGSRSSSSDILGTSSLIRSFSHSLKHQDDSVWRKR
jgi:hypothetical protein